MLKLKSLVILVLPLLLLLLFFNIAYSKPFSFAVVGDSLKGDNVFRKVVSMLNKDSNLAFVVHLGDFAYWGKASEYQKYNQLLKQLKIRCINVLGNHELPNGGYYRFLKYYGNPDSSWDYKNCHFIKLDNVTSWGFSKSQYYWLANELEKNKDKNIFVFMHKPIYDFSGVFPSEEQIKQHYVAKAVELFQKYNVKYIFNGHIHAYQKKKLRGVTFINTGGGGSPLHLPFFMGGFYHYIKISVNGDKVSDRIVVIK